MDINIFTIRYEYSNGSLPPPYHFEYTLFIRVQKSTGEIRFFPDYAGKDTPCWEKTFPIQADKLQTLLDLIRQKQVLCKTWIRPEQLIVGGSQQWLVINTNQGDFNVPTQLNPEDAERMEEIYQSIKPLVPDEIWQKVKTLHQEYEARF